MMYEESVIVPINGVLCLVFWRLLFQFHCISFLEGKIIKLPEKGGRQKPEGLVLIREP